MPKIKYKKKGAKSKNKKLRQTTSNAFRQGVPQLESLAGFAAEGATESLLNFALNLISFPGTMGYIVDPPYRVPIKSLHPSLYIWHPEAAINTAVDKAGCVGNGDAMMFAGQ